MKIVSIIRDSFQEYQGEQSLVLFSLGCNLACPGCYNLEEISDKNNVIGNAIDIIEENVNELHEAVVFLGGEPTIWGKDLIEAIKYVKEVKQKKVKVFTNGLNPLLISELNRQNLVDSYSVDFKGIDNIENIIGKDIQTYAYLDTLETTLKNIIDKNISLELRTTTWESVQNLEKVKDYVRYNYPNINHILTKPFSIS